MGEASAHALRRAIWDKWAALPPPLMRAHAIAIQRGYPISYAAGVFVSIALALTIHANSFWSWHIAALALHLAIGTAALVRWRDGKRRDWRVDDPTATLRATVIEAAATGFGWFLFLATIGLGSTDQELIVTTTAIAGVVAIGALRYAPLPPASLAWLGVAVAICALYAIFANIPAGVFLFLAVFVALLARTVMGQAALVSEQFAQGEALARAAGERDLLRAAAQREELQQVAHAAETRHRAQLDAERDRRAEIARIADRFERQFVAAISELAAAAEQTRTSAGGLTSTTAATRDEIRGVADRARQILDAVIGEILAGCFPVASTGTAAIAALHAAGLAVDPAAEQVEQRISAQAVLADAVALAIVALAVAQRGAPQAAGELGLRFGIDHLGAIGRAELGKVGARDHALRSALRRAMTSFAAAMSSIIACSAPAAARSASSLKRSAAPSMARIVP